MARLFVILLALFAVGCAPVLNRDLISSPQTVADDPIRPDLALIELRLAEHFADPEEPLPTTCAGLKQYDGLRGFPDELERRLLKRFPRLAPFDRCVKQGDWYVDSITGEQAAMFDAHEVNCDKPELCTGWAGYMGPKPKSGWRFYEARFVDGTWRIKRKELDIIVTGTRNTGNERAVLHPSAAPPPLPDILRDTSPLRMQALVAGRLTRDGRCLYLAQESGQRALILWADPDVNTARLDEDDWLVNSPTSGFRMREGSMIRGGGGYYAEDADLAALTGAQIPVECEGQAMQLYDAAVFDPSKPHGTPDPPSAPPATWRPSLLDDARRHDAPVISSETISGIADPREAMFAVLVRDYRKGWPEGTVLCLRDVSTQLLDRMRERDPAVRAENGCEWKDGGVQSVPEGSRAVFLHAVVECPDKRCYAAGGGTYGNVGAEANAYRLTRKGDGWLIERLGYMVVS